MSVFRLAHRFVALACVATLAACSSSTDLATAPATTMAAAKGGGTGGGGGSTPGFYTGHWVQTPGWSGFLQDGTRQELSIEADISQNGSTLSGSAVQYVSYYFTDGTSVTHISLGTPGKLSGSVTATGADFGITKLGEPKLNYGFSLALSADSTSLSGVRLATGTPTTFVR